METKLFTNRNEIANLSVFWDAAPSRPAEDGRIAEVLSKSSLSDGGTMPGTLTGKQRVAQLIAERVQDGQLVGFGTGSTVREVFPFLKERISAERLAVRGVATSLDTARLATEAGVAVLDPRSITRLDWAFDGADEVDPELNLIKGGGGAMVAEKIIASMTDRFVVIVTEDKLVPTLGHKFLVPVAVLAPAQQLVRQRLKELGASEIVPRESKGKIGALTDDFGNVIFDVRFPELTPALGAEINNIPGVVDHGLFFEMAGEVLAAREDGTVISARREGKEITPWRSCP